MGHRVLVPWRDMADAAAERWPRLRVDCYDGAGVPPHDVSDVEFYVVPYDSGSQPRDLIASMPSIRVVQSLNAGVEKLEPLLTDEVLLCNGRGLHDASTAEHALALILAAQREMPRWVVAQRAGEWAHEHTRSVTDSRVTIVGYGSIGRAAERRLLACETTVTKVASRPRPDEGVHGIEELPKLLPDTDILLLILPETASTVGLVGAEQLAALPDGALVVNVGRGRTLDIDALLAESEAGRLRAALDVTDPEPLPPGHPLWEAPGVLLTPHVAGGAACFEPRARALVAEQLSRFDAGVELLNIVRR